jgi:hypothetical protein
VAWFRFDRHVMIAKYLAKVRPVEVAIFIHW